jgi:hypothetical protein
VTRIRRTRHSNGTLKISTSPGAATTEPKAARVSSIRPRFNGTTCTVAIGPAAGAAVLPAVAFGFAGRVNS